MIEFIILQLTAFIVFFIAKLHYFGVLFLMALESCNIPIPSEVILPYAGFLVNNGAMNIHLAAFAGGLGCLVGSILSYWLGHKLGRPFLWKYGRWLLISRHDLNRADRFILKYGNATYFFSRLMPVVRTFISFVAGVSKGDFKKFCLYTFIGSWIWSYILIYLGVKMGENWDKLGPLWDSFHEIFVILVIIAIVWHVVRSFKNHEEPEVTEVQQ